MYSISFCGHHNVRATHGTTTEITTEKSLTPRGDCIVGVGASSGCAGLPADIKRALRDRNVVVRVDIVVGSRTFTINGRGDPHLTLEHPDDIVIRKSGFVCPRTLAVHCDAAANDMPRDMTECLQKGQGGVLHLSVS